MLVRLLKPGKGKIVEYEGELLARGDAWATIRARWGRGGYDFGLLDFAPGDTLIEYFYSERWYNIFRVHAADGRLKGWYCNVTRPAVISADTIESEDLELDLLVAADRARTRVDDEDEFLARGFDRETQAMARQAVRELEAMIARGEAPFHTE